MTLDQCKLLRDNSARPRVGDFYQDQDLVEVTNKKNNREEMKISLLLLLFCAYLPEILTTFEGSFSKVLQQMSL